MKDQDAKNSIDIIIKTLMKYPEELPYLLDFAETFDPKKLNFALESLVSPSLNMGRDLTPIAYHLIILINKFGKEDLMPKLMENGLLDVFATLTPQQAQIIQDKTLSRKSVIKQLNKMGLENKPYIKNYFNICYEAARILKDQPELTEIGKRLAKIIALDQKIRKSKSLEIKQQLKKEQNSIAKGMINIFDAPKIVTLLKDKNLRKSLDELINNQDFREDIKNNSYIQSQLKKFGIDHSKMINLAFNDFYPKIIKKSLEETKLLSDAQAYFEARANGKDTKLIAKSLANNISLAITDHDMTEYFGTARTVLQNQFQLQPEDLNFILSISQKNIVSAILSKSDQLVDMLLSGEKIDSKKLQDEAFKLLKDPQVKESIDDLFKSPHFRAIIKKNKFIKDRLQNFVGDYTDKAIDEIFDNTYPKIIKRLLGNEVLVTGLKTFFEKNKTDKDEARTALEDITKEALKFINDKDMRSSIAESAVELKEDVVKPALTKAINNIRGVKSLIGSIKIDNINKNNVEDVLRVVKMALSALEDDKKQDLQGIIVEAFQEKPNYKKVMQQAATIYLNDDKAIENINKKLKDNRTMIINKLSKIIDRNEAKFVANLLEKFTTTEGIEAISRYLKEPTKINGVRLFSDTNSISLISGKLGQALYSFITNNQEAEPSSSAKSPKSSSPFSNISLPSGLPQLYLKDAKEIRSPEDSRSPKQKGMNNIGPSSTSPSSF